MLSAVARAKEVELGKIEETSKDTESLHIKAVIVNLQIMCNFQNSVFMSKKER